MPIPSKIGAACLAAFGFSTGASAVTANYLQVAGGGGGAVDGGGGAGGLLSGTTSLSIASSYTITVGAGGTGSLSAPTNGSNSQIGSLTASVGGGKGGTDGNNNAGSGGSGVVILRMLTSKYSSITTGSPTVTTDGLYTVVKYTASGTYTA